LLPLPAYLQLFNTTGTLGVMNVQRLGTYIRGQREGSRLSLSKLSGLAGVSIPYLSQVERGLRRPSADILQAIARALSISAETLYVQAGILEARPAADVPAAIMADAVITERQKQALVQIYEAFRSESVARPTPETPSAAPRRAPRPRAAAGERAARVSRAEADASPVKPATHSRKEV
jgi:transcriptional regulator with XRE-family HTH domain